MTFTEAIICVKFGLELFKKTEVSYIVMWLSIQVHDISVADRQTRQSHVLAKICFTGIENNGDHSKALLNVLWFRIKILTVFICITNLHNIIKMHNMAGLQI